MIPPSCRVTAVVFVLSPLRLADSAPITRYAFVLIFVALVLLGLVMKNEWHDLLVILGLVLFGLGQGALVTQLFNVLVTSAPLKFVGDVGSLRGTAGTWRPA